MLQIQPRDSFVAVRWKKKFSVGEKERVRTSPSADQGLSDVAAVPGEVEIESRTEAPFLSWKNYFLSVQIQRGAIRIITQPPPLKAPGTSVCVSH